MNSVKVFFHSFDFICQSGFIHLLTFCFFPHTHSAFIKPAATLHPQCFATFLTTSQGWYIPPSDKLPPTCLHENLLQGGFSKYFLSPFSIPSDGGEEEEEREAEEAEEGEQQRSNSPSWNPHHAFLMSSW